MSVGAESQTSSSAGSPGLRIRQVSTDPRAPIAFVYMTAKPYAEPPTTTSVLDELFRLIGPASIDKLMQE